MKRAAVDKRDISLKDALEMAGDVAPGQELSISGLHGASGAFLLASFFSSENRPLLAVLSDTRAAARFAEDLRFFLGPEAVYLFPETELLPFELKAPHPSILAARMELYHRFTEGRPFVTVTTARNLVQKLAPAPVFESRVIRLVRDEEYMRDVLVSDLLERGFTRVPMVEERGEVSVRGAIVDIFPATGTRPLRVEFFGDTVESIRSFDTRTQRSVAALNEAIVLPAGEAGYGEAERAAARKKVMERAAELDLPPEVWQPIFNRLKENSPGETVYGLYPYFNESLDTFFDHMPGETVLFIPNRRGVVAAIEEFQEEIKEREESFVERKRFFLTRQSLYAAAAEIAHGLLRFPVIAMESLIGGGGKKDGREVTVASRSNIELKGEVQQSRTGRDLPLKPLAEAIGEWVERGTDVYITAHNRAQAERTMELLQGYGIKALLSPCRAVLSAASKGVFISEGSLSAGFSLLNPAIAFISEEEIFGARVNKRPPPPARPGEALTELGDLSEGDFIVHTLHGIGLYRGLKRRIVEGVAKDFLLLEYLGGDRLYMPVERMDRLVRYNSFEGRADPELDKLGGLKWKKTKGKIKKAIENMAGELLKLYAARQVAPGFAFSAPEATFREMEAGFEYEETPDQARAIEECLSDMMKPSPMDRLVCGDVGYGKTEVAIRAAFKAVLDGKQVAILVPTTVLAQQHYITFTRRLGAYPVNVEVISRFRTKKEQREVLKKLAAGGVDIIIGTHRLAQGDISFKDLGLVIIDEEHRFGVRQKERLKKLRSTVDVLALTATPIPRTLHMSLASLRDLSIINTPPEDRLAVRTEVTRFDESLIKEAIEREMDRGGQVFFVHNRVQSMPPLEEMLGRILPHARIAVAHGQMREHELEKKMLGFVNREFDVLLSTAIIESGLDIPLANTIIINRADAFGLAELYQLRGRVGRSSHRAYAYFMIPETMNLTPLAEKRLEVIRELSEPGSGFKVAAYDLEIRGAGELLGTNQSGQIASVGFEMYTRILEDTVAEMKGETISEEAEPEVNIKVSQYIPDDYVPHTGQRLGLYKRFASIKNDEELRAIEEEVRDRYGPLPVVVENILETVSIRLLLKSLKARELDQKAGRLYINFNGAGDTATDVSVVNNATRLVRLDASRFRISSDGRFSACLGKDAEPLGEAQYVLKELLGGCYSES
ncbi:MAG: transcription-repair coupling factor [Thermodesulfobacteriota bacterium]